MYRLCIFDLDGTLLNTVYALTYVTNLTLDAFGLRHVTPEETKRIVGNGYRMQMKRALVLAGDEKLVHYEASLPMYMENFSKYCLKDVEPYDGIRELLASLKEVGVHVAVLSNKPHEQAIVNIETFFGKGYFDVVRTGYKTGRVSVSGRYEYRYGNWAECRNGHGRRALGLP